MSHPVTIPSTGCAASAGRVLSIERVHAAGDSPRDGERWFGRKDLDRHPTPRRTAPAGDADGGAGGVAGALSVAFAVHLDEVRARRLDSSAFCYGEIRTTTRRPEIGPGEVRLPHLVVVIGAELVSRLVTAGCQVVPEGAPPSACSVASTADRLAADAAVGESGDDAAGELADVVIWEVMPADQVPDWLGKPPPGNDFVDLVERRLTQLLMLKAAVRLDAVNRHVGLGPPEPDRLADLHRLLTPDGYLSIRLVWRNEALFRRLLAPALEHEQAAESPERMRGRRT